MRTRWSGNRKRCMITMGSVPRGMETWLDLVVDRTLLRYHGSEQSGRGAAHVVVHAGFCGDLSSASAHLFGNRSSSPQNEAP